ncbi:MAG TPA: 30S ribosomal protein S21 [Limnochordales bacterium]
MTEIRVGDDEPLESALRRFRRLVQQEGILAEARRREHYTKPSARRRQRGRGPGRRRP